MITLFFMFNESYFYIRIIIVIIKTNMLILMLIQMYMFSNRRYEWEQVHVDNKVSYFIHHLTCYVVYHIPMYSLCLYIAHYSEAYARRDAAPARRSMIQSWALHSECITHDSWSIAFALRSCLARLMNITYIYIIYHGRAGHTTDKYKSVQPKKRPLKGWQFVLHRHVEVVLWRI